ncbi:efflux RND transporter periplasmic adaptor subunit [Paracoccus sediminis]|uniref:Efflux RND transporter periplasmic adaptor subunit n=1 Tax=Paracoccus sediminis TaxID=1214787 RepID=A0A238W2I3_9RHOB|nr:efflux RND transporter periplasmic adaptor subunit [Paracoccus sediminis]TBN51521.1 efflux RND transporter periplasmic adaptor subunit [Paracoccus sediminis]SNR40805.1 RND family efflux transporter, MFP subunit [Paracoccus sediminis]
MMRFAAALIALSIAAPAHALDLSGWLDFSSHAENIDPIRPVVSEIVQDRGSDARWIPGVVASRTQVTMAFQTLGRMVSRPVDLGDRVRQGDVLANLAAEDLAATTRAAEAALAAAEVQRDTARLTLERTQALVARNVASAAQLEQAQRAATAAEAGAEQARSALVQARDAQGYARMTAPFAGVVSAVYEAPGSVLGAGTPVLQLSAENRREAVIDLPESALASLPDRAVFTVWQRMDPDRQMRAVLDRIDPVADAATRTRRLYLTLPPDAPFRLGSLVRARLGTASEPALMLSAAAIFRRDGAPHVWRVLRDDGSARVEAVPITPAGDFHDRVLIQDGLAPGDEVVVRGVNSLSDGQPVGPRVRP